MIDHRFYAPATLRNREPILNVLRGLLPDRGTVLEIASGTGEHAIYFARELPALKFQPSDPSAAALLSIAAWTAASGSSNIRPPLALDTQDEVWPAVKADAVLCINMIHIAPWAATLGLFRGAAALLPAGAPLYLYGPYRRHGVITTPSNEAFDQSLRQQNASWGLRSLEAVADVAGAAGFSAPAVVEMPANNLSVVFRRRS